ncbi:MAG: MBL fold metallo-hydrolase [Vulcanibacillus sp.]
MRINRLNSRNIIISYPELDQTNVFVVYGQKYTYICDTFLGPDSMEPIKMMIVEDKREQPIIIFNSHHDWDHVWGNCAFEGSIILAHTKCKEYLNENFYKDFEKNKHHSKGKVVLTYPNLLFSQSILFSEDDVEFFFTPGHTGDSASCYDKKTRTLYVGDNLEDPIPYIQYKNLEEYIDSLNKYIGINSELIITGHGEVGSIDLLNSNLKYIKSLYKNEKIDDSTWSDEIKERHELNMTKLK